MQTCKLVFGWVSRSPHVGRRASSPVVVHPGVRTESVMARSSVMPRPLTLSQSTRRCPDFRSCGRPRSTSRREPFGAKRSPPSLAIGSTSALKGGAQSADRTGDRHHLDRLRQSATRRRTGDSSPARPPRSRRSSATVVSLWVCQAERHGRSVRPAPPRLHVPVGLVNHDLDGGYSRSTNCARAASSGKWENSG